MSEHPCYLVRHAVAELRGEAWPDDDLRPLSKDGARRMRQVVKGLAGIGVEIDVVLTSPLVRARETAALLGAGLLSRPRIVELDALAPGGTPLATMAALRPFSKAEGVALVGHEPDLGILAAWLLGLPQPLAFRKGAVCRIDVALWPPRPAGQLVWFATSKILRAGA
jgi:phosphohistidine phosphatase